MFFAVKISFFRADSQFYLICSAVERNGARLTVPAYVSAHLGYNRTHGKKRSAVYNDGTGAVFINGSFCSVRAHFGIVYCEFDFGRAGFKCRFVLHRCRAPCKRKCYAHQKTECGTDNFFHVKASSCKESPKYAV